jgi:hypothetical protein
LIDEVQAHLEAIYGFRCAERAQAYVVGPELARRLGGTGRVEEELLLEEDGEELSVALCFTPELLERLEGYRLGGPRAALEGVLDAYCQLTEGVSHFLYLLQTAVQGRRVSLLELEAQAEIDKFASCLLQRWADGDPAWPQALHARLFDTVRFHDHLSPAEGWRYREANRLARNYCKRLLRLVTARRLDRLLSELRYGYRLGAAAKLDYLAQAA